MNVRNRLAAAKAAFLTAAVLPGLALAQSAPASFDTSDVEATIGAGLVAVGAIGAALLIMKIVKVVWRKIG